MEQYQLKQKQSLNLKAKIDLSKNRIRKWFEYWKGEVYIAFSGGKDSTVLLHLVRSIYPNVPAVFVDTGLEYPEIREFVRTIDNVIWIRPKMNFKEVLDKYGYPVISKSVSMAISRYRNTKYPEQKRLRKYGGLRKDGRVQKMGVIPKKWHFLIDAPFKISEKCCEVMKKSPFKRFEKKTGLKPFLGTMAGDSFVRQGQYLKYGCNAFNKKLPVSQPLGFWTDDDIWNYIKKFKVSYSKIYDMGERRTGCMFCMFGAHLEKDPTRFQRMQLSHPKLYDYCMDKLKLAQIMDYLDVKFSIAHDPIDHILNSKKILKGKGIKAEIRKK